MKRLGYRWFFVDRSGRLPKPGLVVAGRVILEITERFLPRRN